MLSFYQVSLACFREVVVVGEVKTYLKMGAFVSFVFCFWRFLAKRLGRSLPGLLTGLPLSLSSTLLER